MSVKIDVKRVAMNSWRRMKLRNELKIDEYNEMKKRIEELEKKVNKWGSYVKQYCPEFRNEK